MERRDQRFRVEEQSAPLQQAGGHSALNRIDEERGIRIVLVPDDEFETMGPNVLALEPRVALALARNRQTRTRLARAGVEVLTYSGVELSKGDGGPTCLTRPLLRDGL